MPELTKQIAIRLPASLLERVEEHVGRLQKEHPGLTVRRADAIRVLLLHALGDVEEDSD